MIPNIFHFIFGLSPDFGGKPFGLVHYIAIKSCLNINRPDKVNFYFEYEPDNYYWSIIKKDLTLVKILAPDEFQGKKLNHVAHKADVLRLQILQSEGGVYMDLDTICVRPLGIHYDSKFIIGAQAKCDGIYNFIDKLKVCKNRRSLWPLIESKEIYGLCNAVMMAEPNSEFVRVWLDTYNTFRSTGRDEFWAEHSVEMPKSLAAIYPEFINILKYDSFHYPLFDEHGLELLFTKNYSNRNAYVHHLWESLSWDIYLSNLTVEKILDTDSTYHNLAKKHISDIK